MAARLHRQLGRGASGVALGLVSLGLATLALASFAACRSGPSGPFFGDENFLVVGVSPEEEADAVSKELAVDGRTEYLRLRGPTFTALGFTDPDGQPAWVRAITPRGIELALDPTESHLLERGERYELIAPATPGLHDADGDGFDDLIVLKRSYHGEQACLLAYRIQGSGFIDLITDGQDALAAARGSVTDDVAPCSGVVAADGGVLDGGK